MTMYEIGDPWPNNNKSGKFEEDGNKAEGLIPFTQLAFKNMSTLMLKYLKHLL